MVPVDNCMLRTVFIFRRNVSHAYRIYKGLIHKCILGHTNSINRHHNICKFRKEKKAINLFN